MEGLIALGVKFENLHLDRRILKALEKQGYKNPTLVQEKAIPLALQGKDILARAKTGSGKTAAYVIPVLQKILASKEAPGAKKGVRCVILLPTRELCSQVTQVVEDLALYTKGLITVADLGLDVEPETQTTMLRDKPDVIVTTPSRLYTFLKDKSIDLKVCFQSLVVDEADLTLSLGYDADIKGIQPYLPKVYQGYLMSATLDERTNEMRDILLHTPVVLHLKDGPNDSQSTNLLTEAVLRCGIRDKFLVTYALLRLGLIQTKVILFVNTIETCFQLKLFLDRFSIKTSVLSSELPRESRLHIIKEFNEGTFSYLIATDELIDDLGVEPEEQMKQELEFGSEHKIAEVIDVDEEPKSKKAKTEKREKKNNGKESKKDEDDDESEEEEDSDEEGEDEEREERDGDVSMTIKEEIDVDDEDVQVATTKKERVKKEGDIKREGDIKKEEESDDDDEIIGETEEEKKEREKKRKRKELKIEKAKLADPEYSVARGVDFKHVATVVNFDFPKSTKSYIHRIGRTARGGEKGLAISLISLDDEQYLENVHGKRNKIIPEFGFQMKSIESFRYRCEDILNSVTHKQIKLARAECLRKEILTSTQLKTHFKNNPTEKLMLKNAHSKAVIPLSAAKRATLRNIPNYLVPLALVGNVNQNPAEDQSHAARKKKWRGQKGKRRDPLMGHKKGK